MLAGVILTLAASVAGGSATGSDVFHAGADPARSSVASTPAAPAERSGLAPHGRATSASPVAPPTLTASAPVRLQVPSIGIDSDLMELGLADDGTLEVPPDGFPAGWYTGAPSPGELGPAVVAGHVDWDGRPGVFSRLRDLTQGDAIIIDREDGIVAEFRVTHVEQYRKSQFPTDAVYGDTDHAGLRLITCGGSFDRQTHHYVDNIVAFAELVAARGADAAVPVVDIPSQRE
jgi:sortase (surface protein transpeptidase)